MPDSRFIEESFPVKEVSFESAREKNIRHGHVSTLHIWWARRPLASSRATAYAALVPTPKTIEERQSTRQFIIDFSRWENSLNSTMIQKAQEDILRANGGKPPRILDPFGGGGSIPLEALRLGCETFSGDLNPVAVLIQRCTLEYPQKFGKPGEVFHESEVVGTSQKSKMQVENVLLADVKRWANWVLKEAKAEIGRFYPADPDGSTPVGYIWARTIPCQNPNCGAEIPLMRQFWLAKTKKRVSLFPFTQCGRVHFRIVGDSYEEMPRDFDPEKGTVSRAVAKCPVCGSMVDDKTTRRLFQEGKSGQRMVAVVLHKDGQSGKRYRLATEKDMDIFRKAQNALEGKSTRLREEWGMEPVPDEPLPPPGTLGFRIQRYKMTTWGDLFNSRQKLALITFADAVRRAHKKMVGEEYEAEYAKAVAAYLGVLADRLADKSGVLVRYNSVAEKIESTFSRQALPMIWDYVETNPFTDVGWRNMQGWIEEIIQHCSQIDTHGVVSQSSAASLPYDESFFDAVLTDPPYYDNVPYSYLSDFFYVWLKRTVGDAFPDLFSTPLTPKKNEIVAYSQGPGGFDEGKRQFEEMLKKSFQEIHRVLRPDGIALIVYAHKSTAGWETLINSLLDSGLIMTGAWPLSTEKAGRIRSQESAALASSIYIVCRKMVRVPTGFYNEVKEALTKHLNQKLERLWAEGVSGADFFIAAIGSAIEVFGKYERVIDFEGNTVRADRLLEDVRIVVTDYAVRRILKNGFAGEITDLTRFYVLYRWEYGEARAEFDEARKLAQSCGIDLSLEWNRGGIVRKDKEFITVLGPHERKPEKLNDSAELIDVLHHVLLLWEKSRREEMLLLLGQTGFGVSEAFFRVAQAISETLPSESREKKLLDGFLSGRERLQQESRRNSRQGELF